MSEQTINVEEITQATRGRLQTARKQLNRVADTARRAALAGVGAVLMVGDELGDLVVNVKERVHQRYDDVRSRTESLSTDLVDRGVDAQKDIQTRIETAVENRRERLDRIETTTEEAGSRLSSTVGNLRHRVDVQTHDALETLNKGVKSFGSKAEKLRKTTEEKIEETINA